jgi:hypothetical protein
MSFKAELLCKSNSFPECVRAMIIGFGDDWKDVLIVWILRDKIAEF